MVRLKPRIYGCQLCRSIATLVGTKLTEVVAPTEEEIKLLEARIAVAVLA